MKILFVISRFGSHRSGGHTLSAASIGKALMNLGHEVDFASNTRTQPEYLESVGAKVFYVPVALTSRSILRFFSGYWSRVWRLLSLMRHEQYDLVIAMDSLAAWHSSPAACILKVPMLPIIAGGANAQGGLPHVMTLVFSEENKLNLTRLGWKQDSIVVSEGRIDFSHFRANASRPRMPSPGKIKMLYMSRLSKGKWRAFKSFVDELQRLSFPDLGVTKLEVDVAGDGPDGAFWREYIANYELPSEASLRFIGHQQVTGDFLRQYSYIVTMGRGVIEAIVSGLPAAISGPEGYKGLVRPENLEVFARTNFTGRGVAEDSTLMDDLQRLLQGSHEDSRAALVSLVRERYSSESGAQRILQCVYDHGPRLVPGNGRIIRIAAMHLSEIRRLLWRSIQKLFERRSSRSHASGVRE